ncbi:MAG: ATP-binding protein, partial [Acidobacteria bacterium]|nr:ATP-binding protein [Acidobacteriota bacterium]
MKPPAVYYEQILAERARNKQHENRRLTATPRPSKPTRKRPKRETMRNYNHQSETLHDFRGSPGAFINAGTPVVFLGDSGTGKTHLLIGTGVAACHTGLSVRYT